MSKLSEAISNMLIGERKMAACVDVLGSDMSEEATTAFKIEVMKDIPEKDIQKAAAELSQFDLADKVDVWIVCLDLCQYPRAEIVSELYAAALAWRVKKGQVFGDTFSEMMLAASGYLAPKDVRRFVRSILEAAALGLEGDEAASAKASTLDLMVARARVHISSALEEIQSQLRIAEPANKLAEAVYEAAGVNAKCEAAGKRLACDMMLCQAVEKLFKDDPGKKPWLAAISRIMVKTKIGDRQLAQAILDENLEPEEVSALLMTDMVYLREIEE